MRGSAQPHPPAQTNDRVASGTCRAPSPLRRYGAAWRDGSGGSCFAILSRAASSGAPARAKPSRLGRGAGREHMECRLGEMGGVQRRDRVSVRSQAPHVIREQATCAAVQEQSMQRVLVGQQGGDGRTRKRDDQRVRLRHPAAPVGLRQVVEADCTGWNVQHAALGLGGIRDADSSTGRSRPGRRAGSETWTGRAPAGPRP